MVSDGVVGLLVLLALSLVGGVVGGLIGAGDLGWALRQMRRWLSR